MIEDIYFEVETPITPKKIRELLESALNKPNVGVKDNKNKLPMSKLKVQFPNALKAVVSCSKFGHEKYKEFDKDWLNYKRVHGGSSTYRDAFERHSLHKTGVKDEDSGLPHIFHELWNKMAEVELWIEENNYKFE